MSHRGWLRGLVFVGGMAGLGVEMAASRLLAPFFGTSLLVWANLIGLILLYLAVGAWLGGRLADRTPDPGVLYGVTALAGFLIGVVPFVARPILTASLQNFFDASVGLFVGSLLATVALLAVPVTLLGTLTPFAVRLSLDDVRTAGRDVGGLVALSTVGSIVGVFLAVLVLIPALGTRRSFLFFAVALLGMAAVGLLLHARRRASLGAAAGLASLLLLELVAPSVVRPGAGVLYEGESPYHFVQALEAGRDRCAARDPCAEEGDQAPLNDGREETLRLCLHVPFPLPTECRPGGERIDGGLKENFYPVRPARSRRKVRATRIRRRRGRSFHWKKGVCMV